MSWMKFLIGHSKKSWFSEVFTSLHKRICDNITVFSCNKKHFSTISNGTSLNHVLTTLLCASVVVAVSLDIPGIDLKLGPENFENMFQNGAFWRILEKNQHLLNNPRGEVPLAPLHTPMGAYWRTRQIKGV